MSTESPAPLFDPSTLAEPGLERHFGVRAPELFVRFVRWVFEKAGRDGDAAEDLYLDLTGLYHGRPVGEKSSMESGALPDRIHLYRRAILDEWVETGVRLDDLVAHVTIHEIGHHFGLSDDDMHALEDAAGPNTGGPDTGGPDTGGPDTGGPD